jgi:hypothetical protein
MSETQVKSAPQRAPGQLAASEVQRAVDRLREEQNLVGGLAAGAAAALIGAVIWAVITDVTGYQIGFMAIGVGFIVGYAVRIVGKGIDQQFGFVGAVLALLGCVVGNVFAIIGVVSSQEGLSYGEVWAQIDMVAAMTAWFSPMDLLFYGIAVYEGYKLSFRQVTEGELRASARR